ncbi:COG4315 family predicted lipoprotein [Acidimangrovimonas pyrenivorans]|uniref:Lipoprotein with Yx(FWY)xxD motif n=1 Tax=Acidimangrovimonas pyrenivorans TaxID=2030798 RepID=A0ABV7AHF3_9RHOB
MTFRRLILPLAVAIALPAALSAAPAMDGKSQKGTILTDSHGMSLYTFVKDKEARSACNGDCAVKWPPLAAKAGDRPEGHFGIIARDDGSLQWTYKGKPLYTWFKDKTSGDVTGDGVKGVWHLARP